MSIKNNKPSFKSGYKQGYFPVNESKKYVGKRPVIYRSSWEFKFCKYCEETDEILRWSSETVEIPYFNPVKKTYSKYYPDFLVFLKNGKKLLVEVKPKNQIYKPEKPKRKTKKALKNFNYLMEQYLINMAKFNAAKKWCDDRGYIFKIVTEDFFKK